MELANFGPLLHTASTSTNNSAVTSLVEFLVPLKKIHASVHTCPIHVVTFTLIFGNKLYSKEKRPGSPLLF